MIKVDRSLIPEPAELSSRYRGKTEQERVVTKFLKHLGEGRNPLDFKFNFTAYTKKSLKQALTSLFYGKCAYCESRYAGSQPMDVEHWRVTHSHDSWVVEHDHLCSELSCHSWRITGWANDIPSCKVILCKTPCVEADIVARKGLLHLLVVHLY